MQQNSLSNQLFPGQYNSLPNQLFQNQYNPFPNQPQYNVLPNQFQYNSQLQNPNVPFPSNQINLYSNPSINYQQYYLQKQTPGDSQVKMVEQKLQSVAPFKTTSLPRHQNQQHSSFHTNTFPQPQGHGDNLPNIPYSSLLKAFQSLLCFCERSNLLGILLLLLLLLLLFYY
jgi:hypothetical protein